MRTNADPPKNLCPSTDIHMSSNFRNTVFIGGPNCHLLEDQTIHANSGLRMKHNSIRVWDQQTAADLTG